MGVLLGVLWAMGVARAQQTVPPTLDDVLKGLEDNLQRYHTGVPNFFCDEHVVSQVAPGPRSADTVTDSVFRLKRVIGPDHTASLNESRDVRTVNGHPAKAEDLSGPTILRGAFSGGLAIVSLSQKACMRYTLEPGKPGHPGDPYVVEFASIPGSERPPGCVLQEDGTGRVLVDPATMQIMRMELKAPHHIVTGAGVTARGEVIPPLMGVWVLSIDYAPVLLGGQSFWMPRTITSSATSVNGGPEPTVWSFKAGYSNYHKLEVKSRILPASGSESESP